MGFAHAVTSVFCAPSPRLFRHPRSRGQARGFTLIELVAVVVIIAIVAALAMPSIASRLRDRRTQQAAQTIAQFYSTARMRAMGRGAAVLVRYNASGFQMLEAIRGTAGETDVNCQPLPVSSCVIGNPWALASTSNRLISSFAPAVREEFHGLTIAMADATGTGTPTMDVCFTPMGGAYATNTPGGAMAALSGVPVASVRRMDGSTQVGLTRRVMIVPNGNSHLGVSRRP
jgi:prepilin-type N-terminal cleavage/methylation domain-containing protein